MTNKHNYLTIHGHFYQPPRENPWLEYLERQETALPCHDWNERVCKECYSPNSISKIVGDNGKIVDIVNNYAHMSYNFGPTLLSWMEKYSPHTYEQVIKADIQSAAENNGHGNAIAQVYNHMIMPLANLRDKYTQVIWGIEDFKYRFGRVPEGIWLAETACDDETLGVLADCGIKFTILSPYQAKSCRKIGEEKWLNVENGEIDTTVPYRYNIQSNGKSIDLFFYNANISQAVAFEELLKDGQRFADKLKTGIPKRDCGLVNIATDGESYGHHTKFGDMTLSYILKIKAEQEGFTLINYGNYLEKFPSENEVEIKQVSSWSCCHGVGRWKEDCGCYTGGMDGWNQKWRAPLREALDYLRDKLIKITEDFGNKYFKDVWSARNDYIHVVLNRNDETVKEFVNKNFKENPDENSLSKAIKIMEMQRQAMLMYTSCGWFFNEISGIETIQILKYAARAIQIASDFSDEDIEFEFLNILKNAKSNIPEYGNGKDIYENFVKPNITDYRHIAALWAVKSLYEDFTKNNKLYSYKTAMKTYKKVPRGTSNLVTGRISVKSDITYSSHDVMFALLQFSGGDFHCAVKDFCNTNEYTNIVKDLINTFKTAPTTETIRSLDKYFGTRYFTIKDIPVEERKKILNSVLKGKMHKFQSVYRDVYNEGKGAILYLKSLGLDVPAEFKLAAQYTLSRDFNSIFKSGLFYESAIQHASEINSEANFLGLSLDKNLSKTIFSKLILDCVKKLSVKQDFSNLNYILKLFGFAEQLEITPDITEAQNLYFNNIRAKFEEIAEKVYSSESIYDKKEFLSKILTLGDKLNITTDLYRKILAEKPLKK